MCRGHRRSIMAGGQAGILHSTCQSAYSALKLVAVGGRSPQSLTPLMHLLAFLSLYHQMFYSVGAKIGMTFLPLTLERRKPETMTQCVVVLAGCRSNDPSCHIFSGFPSIDAHLNSQMAEYRL